MSDAGDGAVMLAHATAHAALLYGGTAEDYADIMWQAITDDHLDQLAGRYSIAVRDHGRYLAAARDYALERARVLIVEADTTNLAANPDRRARWIGAATEILRELTRDA